MMLDVVIPKRPLQAALERAVGVADQKSAIPALSNALLSADARVLRVAATNLYMSATAVLEAEVQTSGSIGLPAKSLLERVKAMREGPIQITMDGTAATIKSVGQARRYTVHGISADDFPALPVPTDDGAWVDMSAAALRRLLEQTHRSIATDETRPHVNSLCLDFTGRVLHAVSTDGHRLSLVHAVCDAPPRRALVPLKAVSEMMRFLDRLDGDVGMSFIPGATSDAGVPQMAQMFLRIPGLTWHAKLIEAQFPPYASVIPHGGHVASVSRSALLDAVKAVGVAASEKVGGVRLSFSENKIEIAAESAETGSASDEVACQYSGPALAIGANGKYVEHVCQAGDGDLRVSVSGDLDPIVFRVDNDVDTWVVMPMRVN